MNLTSSEWIALSTLESFELKSRVFTIISETAEAIHVRESDDPDVLSVIPRLASLLEERPELASYREVVSALARSTGLWNYIDKEHADARDQLIAEAVTVPELDNITLHREQIEALNTLFEGRNLILSAPTSFGKSILIDALLASGRYNRVAIVLPTIALLDEFRRRLARRFGDEFKLVMYHSEESHDGKTIFLGTQERLINRSDLGQLDLAVVDEFYKLDPARRDDRSVILNAAVYQLLRKSKQFFFLGPNIQSVRFADESGWRFEFLRTRFSTVAVDTFDLRGTDNKPQRLQQEVRKEANWPALVFASSPDRANKIAIEIANNSSLGGNGEEFAAWIDENFGPNWTLRTVVAAGMGLHHGRIPRAVASHFVRLFNSRDLPVLICTSTLIEGVNTAAKSVLIYDKAINRENFDFFTFSNIRGRAGRLGQHNVGNVFLFHAPPDKEDVDVNPPLFGDLDDAPDELVVHIPDTEMPAKANERILQLGRRLNLTPKELRLASTIGFNDALSLKLATEKAIKAGAAIEWSGRPRYPEIQAVCAVICEVRQPSEFGLRSSNQLTMFLNKLRSARTMKEFFLWYTKSYQGDQSGQDTVFKFLRACEYGLPQLVACVEMFAKRLISVDHSLFIAEMPRWFRPEILKNLDEQGVPIQISEQFIRDGDDLRSLSQRLIEAARDGNVLLNDFERNWVLHALT